MNINRNVGVPLGQYLGKREIVTWCVFESIFGHGSSSDRRDFESIYGHGSSSEWV